MPEEAPGILEEVLGEPEVVDTPDEYSLLFPTVPSELDTAPPDEAEDGSDLVSDIEDQQVPEEVEESNEGEAPPQLDEYRADVAFDWSSLEFFKAANGEPLRVTGAEAIVVWAASALNTPKGKFAIFSPDFGCNLQELLGQPLSDTILFSEAARGVTDCLLQHPRITRVSVDSVYRLPALPDTLLIDISMFIDDDHEPIQFQFLA